MSKRRSANINWVVGHHAVLAVLKTNPERVIELHVVMNSHNKSQAEILDRVTSLGLPIHSVDKRTLSKFCDSEQHQGVVLSAKAKAEGSEKELNSLVENLVSASEPPLLLILDQVTDPHNFGACLRTADAAGVTAVIVAKDNASPITHVV